MSRWAKFPAQPPPPLTPSKLNYSVLNMVKKCPVVLPLPVYTIGLLFNNTPIPVDMKGC